MPSSPNDLQTEALAGMIAPGGALEQQVEQLAGVLHMWHTFSAQERRFLGMDRQAADEILRLLRTVQKQPGGRA